jgi:hypothetical protein
MKIEEQCSTLDNNWSSSQEQQEHYLIMENGSKIQGVDSFTSERGVLFIDIWSFSSKSPRSLLWLQTLRNLFLSLAKICQQKGALCAFSQAASQRLQTAGWRSDIGHRALSFGSRDSSCFVRLIMQSVGWFG